MEPLRSPTYDDVVGAGVGVAAGGRLDECGIGRGVDAVRSAAGRGAPGTTRLTARVCGPNTPSAPPTTLIPAFISSCWTRLTAAPLAPTCTTVPAGAGVDGEEALPVSPRTAAVAASTTPVSGRPLTRWTSVTARWVDGPNVPSAPPSRYNPVARMASCSWRTASPDMPRRRPTADPTSGAAVGCRRRCRGVGRAPPFRQPEIARRVLGDDAGRVESVLALEHAQRGGRARPELAVGAACDVVAEGDELLLHGGHAGAGVTLAQPDDAIVDRPPDGVHRRGRKAEHRRRPTASVPAHSTATPGAGRAGTPRRIRGLSFQSCLSDRMDRISFRPDAPPSSARTRCRRRRVAPTDVPSAKSAQSPR